MRKVLVKTKVYNREKLGDDIVWKPGLFHGFFITYFDDGDKNVQWTAAFVESPETGKVHKLDTDDFRFLTEEELKAFNV
jgi:hypothetical protein